MESAAFAGIMAERIVAEKKALEDVLYQAGAGKVFVSEMRMEQLVLSLSRDSDKALKGFQTVIGITEEE